MSFDEVTAADHETKKTGDKTAFGWLRLVGGIASAACFGYGVRAAYGQARPFKPGEISQRQLLFGVGFAGRALTIATIITCSGYAFIVIIVTAAMDVNSPSQFGAKMKRMFGERLRISGSEKSQSFDDVFK